MADSPAVGDIIKSITDDVKHLVQNEVELAKAELIPSAKKAGIGAGMLGAAGYFGINGLTLLYITVALGIYALGLPLWLSFLIVTVLLLLVAGVLALVGLSSIKKVKGPEKTVAEAKVTVAELKAAVQNGTAAAKAPELEGQYIDGEVVASRAIN